MSGRGMQLIDRMARKRPPREKEAIPGADTGGRWGRSPPPPRERKKGGGKERRREKWGEKGEKMGKERRRKGRREKRKENVRISAS